MTTKPQSTTEPTLEPGAGGHVHRFNAVRVPPEFGHSYLRCAYCGLSKHLESHDASTCDICARISPASAAPVVDGDAGLAIWNGTWPLSDVLTRLADAVDHLLQDHDCDMHGYEGLSFAIPAARWYAEKITAAPVKQSEQVEETLCACQTFMLNDFNGARAYLDDCNFVHTVNGCPSKPVTG